MNTQILEGTYGRGTKTKVFTYGRWYVCKGSVNVNKTILESDLIDGVDVESLQDVDCFTWSKPINTLKQLIKAVES